MRKNRAIILVMLTLLATVVLLACFLAMESGMSLVGQVPSTIDLWGTGDVPSSNVLLPKPISTNLLVATGGDLGLMILGLYVRFKDEPQARI